MCLALIGKRFMRLLDHRVTQQTTKRADNGLPRTFLIREWIRDSFVRQRGKKFSPRLPSSILDANCCCLSSNIFSRGSFAALLNKQHVYAINCLCSPPARKRVCIDTVLSLCCAWSPSFTSRHLTQTEHSSHIACVCTREWMLRVFLLVLRHGNI